MIVRAFVAGAALGVLSVLLGVSVAKADCSQDIREPAEYELAVTEYSYAEAFKHGREGKFTECADEAELTACATTEGFACAREMQVVYSACVGELVCDAWVQGALEDGFVVGDRAIGDAYGSCVRLVMAAGGRY